MELIYIAGLGDVLKNALLAALDFILGLFKSLGETIMEGIPEVMGFLQMDDASIQSFVDFLSVADYFFPLTEIMSFVGILIAAYIPLFLYRLVKSWIPTLT